MKEPKRYDLKSSPLFLAVEQGDVAATLRALNKGESVNIRDRDGNTPLIRASFLGKVDIVRTLLDHGADVNAVNDIGWSGLHFAAQENQELVAKELVGAQAIIDLPDMNGNTPLWNAMFNTNSVVASFLIALGANLDRANNYGISPRELGK